MERSAPGQASPAGAGARRPAASRRKGRRSGARPYPILTVLGVCRDRVRAPRARAPALCHRAGGAQALSSCGAGGPALFRAGGAHPRALRRRARSAPACDAESGAHAPAARRSRPCARAFSSLESGMDAPARRAAPSEARAPAAAVRCAPRARLRRSCAARAARTPPRRAAPRQYSAAHSDRAGMRLAGRSAGPP